MAKAGSTEKVVREIRRHTRRRFSAEEKIRIVLGGVSAGKRASRRSAAAKAWRRISMTAGAKNSLRPARSGCWAIRHAKRRRRKSRTCAAKTASSSRSWPRRFSRIAYLKKSGGLRCGGRYVRLTAAEKHEIIRLVEGSDLSVRRTLRELGVHRSTFYAWYRRYQAVGAEGR